MDEIILIVEALTTDITIEIEQGIPGMTAYQYAVIYGGYTGTEEQFGIDLAEVAGITLEDIENWNEAFSWGDHSTFGYALLTDLANYEPVINKKTAFNVDFGTTSGTAAEGNHKHYQLHEPDGTNPFVYTDASGQLHIDGNIIQNGSAYETHAEQVYTKDDYIILRDEATAGLANGSYAGLKAKKYDGVNDGHLVFDNQGWARVGDVGSEQPLSTRIETPTNLYLAYWDDSNKRLDFLTRETFVDASGDTMTGVLTLPMAVFGTYSATGSEATGSTYYDTVNHTLATVLENGVTLQHGQEVHIYGKNTSGAIIPNGAPVAIVSNNGQFTAFGVVDITTSAAYAFCGIATQEIGINSFGYVTKIGVVHELDTSLFDEGKPVYVSATGTLTKTYPTVPNYVINVGIVEYKHAQHGRINVISQIVPRMQDLSDVNGTPLATSGQIAVWNQTAGYFDYTAKITDYALVSSLSSYVPFTGAGSNVVLGAHTLSTTSGLITPKIYPASDSTTAFQINKADGTTNVVNVDTTNGRVGIGGVIPTSLLDIYSSNTTSWVKIRNNAQGAFSALTMATDNNQNRFTLYSFNSSYGSTGQYQANKSLIETHGDLYVSNLTNSNLIIYNSKVGLFNTSPTAYLHIAAGTASASTAPLKFTSGVLNTVPEAGAIEYLTNDLYFTDSTATRRNFVLNGAGFTGGQTIVGGTAVTDILSLKGTTGNGTATSPAIQFLVGNNGGTVAGTVLNNGNVGIGTTSPNKLLEVKTSSNTNDVVMRLTNEGTNIATGVGLEFYNKVGQAAQIAKINAVVGGEFINNSLGFDVQGSRRMTILGVNGNVGIGTTSPTELLTLGTAGTTAGTLSLAGATSGKAILQVSAVAGTPTLTLPTVTGTLALTSDINSWKFGDQTTNYTTFEADGTMKMVGTATVWDDLRVPIFTRSGGSSPTFTSGFAGNANLYAYYFATGTTNNVYFEVQMPHSWKGSTIYPHVHWSPTTTGTGSVRWFLEYTWVNINGTFGASATVEMDTTLSVASQWKHIIAAPAAGLTPGVGTQDGISAMIIGRIYRVGGGTGDTYAANAALLGIDIHYEMDTLGSRQEYIK